MSTEAIALIGSLVGALVLLGAGIYFWMNRTPRVKRDADGRLPLFGGDHDVDVDGNPLVALPRHTPPPAVLTALTTPFERAARDSTPVEMRTEPSRSEVRSVVQPPGAAGSAAFRAAHAEGSSLSSMELFPSPLMPPTPPRSVAPVSSSAQTGGLSSSGRPAPAVHTFTTTPSRSMAGPQLQGPPASPPVPSGMAAQSPAYGVPTTSPVAAYGVPGSMIEGHLVRFSVPAEGTLQFLPGRLEIAAGRDTGREIRFVRVPGPNGAEVTFGRSEGELYRHVQLRDQTVSRSHARMRLLDGTWHLLNLSQTNPVVHNGRALTGGEERPVADGDRIEMGEVLFTFKSR